MRAMAPVKVREQAMATATAREPVQEKAPVQERGTGQAQETAPARVQEMGRAQETAMATVRAPVQARVHCSWVTEPVSRCRRRMRRASA